ncbi:drug/metabolite transporter (DMT)-like permease [Pseudorhizobium tarimense]|uniref:Drug/metabolite transporter (DMT)-like permease n=1 Tax=Pseudorhizobium tarimense TaxID=1079109 RepID=A0ABV2H081_9HYPH|nr:DMT family transporter [Pseudorhizobium tarimense]MCJ8517287.1 DMT family transporter [Pseudorhizobium tarimense]
MTSEAGNPLRGIMFKISSVVIFVMMQTCIKAAGADVPAGQITFYRSAFALIPIIAYLAWRRDLRTAAQTDRPFGHLKRGFFGILSMAFGFYGLVHLPLPEAIAIGYASPLMAVVFAALILGEQVRVYRWSAVVAGMVGVLIVSWPKLTLFRDGGMESSQALGAAAVLMAAILSGLAMVQVRQLVRTEKTPTIVFYFSLTGALFSLVSLPFGWATLTGEQALLLISAGIFGGVAQIFLTESYRHADVSTVAPFEYTSFLLGIVIAFVLFNDVPTLPMIIGTAITMAAGIFIVYREHRLGIERKAARKASAPPN